VETEPFKSNLWPGNRIVAGLSEVEVVVTEAQAKSGTLITANYALQQNSQYGDARASLPVARSAGPNNCRELVRYQSQARLMC